MDTPTQNKTNSEDGDEEEQSMSQSQRHSQTLGSSYRSSRNQSQCGTPTLWETLLQASQQVVGETEGGGEELSTSQRHSHSQTLGQTQLSSWNQSQNNTPNWRDRLQRASQQTVKELSQRSSRNQSQRSTPNLLNRLQQASQQAVRDAEASLRKGDPINKDQFEQAEREGIGGNGWMSTDVDGAFRTLVRRSVREGGTKAWVGDEGEKKENAQSLDALDSKRSRSRKRKGQKTFEEKETPQPFDTAFGIESRKRKRKGHKMRAGKGDSTPHPQFGRSNARKHASRMRFGESVFHSEEDYRKSRTSKSKRKEKKRNQDWSFMDLDDVSPPLSPSSPCQSEQDQQEPIHPTTGISSLSTVHRSGKGNAMHPLQPRSPALNSSQINDHVSIAQLLAGSDPTELGVEDMSVSAPPRSHPLDDLSSGNEEADDQDEEWNREAEDERALRGAPQLQTDSNLTELGVEDAKFSTLSGKNSLDDSSSDNEAVGKQNEVGSWESEEERRLEVAAQAKKVRHPPEVDAEEPLHSPDEDDDVYMDGASAGHEEYAESGELLGQRDGDELDTEGEAEPGNRDVDEENEAARNGIRSDRPSIFDASFASNLANIFKSKSKPAAMSKNVLWDEKARDNIRYNGSSIFDGTFASSLANIFESRTQPVPTAENVPSEEDERTTDEATESVTGPNSLQFKLKKRKGKQPLVNNESQDSSDDPSNNPFDKASTRARIRAETEREKNLRQLIGSGQQLQCSTSGRQPRDGQHAPLTGSVSVALPREAPAPSTGKRKRPLHANGPTTNPTHDSYAGSNAGKPPKRSKLSKSLKAPKNYVRDTSPSDEVGNTIPHKSPAPASSSPPQRSASPQPRSLSPRKSSKKHKLPTLSSTIPSPMSARRRAPPKSCAYVINSDESDIDEQTATSPINDDTSAPNRDSSSPGTKRLLYVSISPVASHRKHHPIVPKPQRRTKNASAVNPYLYNPSESKKERKKGVSRESTFSGLPRISGPFSSEEKSALESFKSRYISKYALNDVQFTELVHASARLAGTVSELWDKVGEVCPRRDRQALQKFCRRYWHGVEKRGRWGKEEDRVLRRLVVEKDKRWVAIAEEMGRMAEDVRDRWRNIVCTDAESEGQGKKESVVEGDEVEGEEEEEEDEKDTGRRARGRWRKEDREALTAAVGEIGALELRKRMKNAPTDFRGLVENDMKKLVVWGDVSKRMGGRRGRLQCMYMWNRLVAQKVVGLGPLIRDTAKRLNMYSVVAAIEKHDAEVKGKKKGRERDEEEKEESVDDEGQEDEEKRSGAAQANKEEEEDEEDYGGPSDGNRNEDEDEDEDEVI